jgi:hypothetical protein
VHYTSLQQTSVVVHVARHAFPLLVNCDEKGSSFLAGFLGMNMKMKLGEHEVGIDH